MTTNDMQKIIEEVMVHSKLGFNSLYYFGYLVYNKLSPPEEALWWYTHFCTWLKTPILNQIRMLEDKGLI